MIIEKRIKLKNNNYYIQVDVEYKKDKNGIIHLCLKDYKDPYYDDGNFSMLIKKVEEEYDSARIKEYDESILFMSDVLYLYCRIPFLSGIRAVYISKNDNIPYSISYVSRKEIQKYIKINHKNVKFNSEFKLSCESTW